MDSSIHIHNLTDFVKPSQLYYLSVPSELSRSRISHGVTDSLGKNNFIILASGDVLMVNKYLA